jgi:hypothetical protein
VRGPITKRRFALQGRLRFSRLVEPLRRRDSGIAISKANSVTILIAGVTGFNGGSFACGDPEARKIADRFLNPRFLVYAT